MGNVVVRKTIVLIAVGYLLSLNSSAQTATPDREVTAKADEYIKNLVRLDHFSGSVLVARDGKVLLSKGYGMANLEYDQPNTPQTKFRIGSVTKQFTATAIMLLQEWGRLSVQDSVCKYVAGCPAAWQPVTVHHLLSHTSGIPSFTEFPDNNDYERRPMTVLATIERFKHKPLDFKPGEKYSYSDSNFLVLGYVVERTSGKSYEVFMAEKIFHPLGMKDSGYDRPRDILKHRATGYAERGGSVQNASYYWEMDTPFAGGSQYSTVEDLYRWSQALDTEKLISKKSLEAMFTPHAPGGYYWYGRINYGYAWRISYLFNRRLVWHEGFIGGFISYIGRYPDDKVTVIILGNREESFIRRASRDLAAIVFGERYALLKEPVKVSPRILDAYVGQYRYENGVLTSIAREGDDLIFLNARGVKTVLIPQSETEFLTSGGYPINFFTDASGRVSHFVAFEDREAKKIK